MSISLCVLGLRIAFCDCFGFDGRYVQLWLTGGVGISRDYAWGPVDASAKTRLIGRPPKNRKPWNKAKNDHTRLSSEARMMIVLIAVKSCRTPRRGRQHRRARKRGTSPSARVHRGRAAQTRHRRLGDVMDTPQNGRPTSTRRPCGARRSLQSVQEGRSIGDVMAVRPSAPASMSYSRRPYRQRVALLLRTTRAKAGRRLR